MLAKPKTAIMGKTFPILLSKEMRRNKIAEIIVPYAVNSIAYLGRSAKT